VVVGENENNKNEIKGAWTLGVPWEWPWDVLALSQCFAALLLLWSEPRTVVIARGSR
jgi:hypothetical protein